MTTQEEILYLTDLLLESARWTRDPDEAYCNIELEIRDRLRRLNGIDTIDENGLAQGNPKTVTKPGQFVEKVEEPLNEDDFKELEAARLNEHLASPEKVWKAKERWKADKVRCNENGHIVWRKRCECIQQPRDNSKGGPAWMWKWMGPATTTDVKKAQEDQMWAEHEQEGK